MSLRWYAFLCGFSYDVLYTIDHLRSISFFYQNAHHDWLSKEYISNWFLVHGGTLEESKSAKYFGLNLDKKVNFNTHVMFMLLLRRPTQLLLFLDATCTTAAGKLKRLPIRSMWDPSLNTHPHTYTTSRNVSTPVVVVASSSLEF